MLSKTEINKVLDILEEEFPNAETELNHSNTFELLIATILSAQCTDVRVNKTTETLFEELKDPEDYIKIGEEELGKKIRSCGFYNMKSKNIIGTCKLLLDKFDGEVPGSIEELMTLPGVGRKTANVVVSNAFNIPAIAVDTHVFRVSNRIGMANANNVEKTEKQLMENINKDRWTRAHNLLIFQGRRVCRSQSPKCDICSVNSYCKYYKKKMKG